MNAQTHPRRLGLVVEDHEASRLWLTEILLRAFPSIEVTEAEDLATARAWLRDRAPSTPAAGAEPVALIDLDLPDGSGVELIGEIVSGHPGMLPVVTTIFDDDGHLFDAIAAGAQGYVLKDQDAAATAALLRRIEQGEPPLSPSIARRILAHFGRAGPGGKPAMPSAAEAEPDPGLTPREGEVLGLIARGLRVGETARVLNLSDHTVAGYVKSIYGKLGIGSRAEAALEAARRGLV